VVLQLRWSAILSVSGRRTSAFIINSIHRSETPPTASDGYVLAQKRDYNPAPGVLYRLDVFLPYCFADTVKVRLQTQSMANPVYSGAIDCFKKTLQWEGVRGLYKGVTSPLAGQMFFRATLFSAFGASKRWLSTNPDGTSRTLTDVDFFKAGFITGAAAAFTEAPIDFYKSQIQVQIIRSKADPSYKPPYTSVGQCVRATLATSGVRGPFQGLGPTLLRNAPANGIYLGSFEVMKRRAAEFYGCETKDLGAATIMGAGGLGGVFYWLAIFPVDVVKSAMMTDNINPAERQYPTMMAAVRKLWAEGGLPRFYKGFSPCLMRAVPANATMLFTVDKVQQLLSDL
jgi:solute carrier family 25 (mitochondrial carnitine/acylcarnitine transporter), member 20/29